jgi:hypothetical protein
MHHLVRLFRNDQFWTFNERSVIAILICRVYIGNSVRIFDQQGATSKSNLKDPASATTIGSLGFEVGGTDGKVQVGQCRPNRQSSHATS